MFDGEAEDAVDDLEVDGVSQQHREGGGTHAVERNPKATAAPQPAAQRLLACRIMLNAIGGEDHRVVGTQDIGPGDGLLVFDPPFASPVPEIKLYWHRRHTMSPAHSWLRQQVLTVCRPLETATP